MPHLAGGDSLYIAVGIIGATVMPHVIYLHSALTNGRTPVRDARERARVLRFERLDVIVALGLAGVVNMAMLAVAAKLFHGSGHTGVSTIEQAHAGFTAQVGGGAALAFSVALLASGASSSSVGTYAGQVVMRGFVGLNIPVFARRLVTMLPALVVLAMGLSPTAVLVLSQVVLSFGIPFALIPLVLLTSRARRDGRARQPPLDQARRRGARRRDHGPERILDRPAGSLRACLDTGGVPDVARRVPRARVTRVLKAPSRSMGRSWRPRPRKGRDKWPTQQRSS